MAFELKPLPYAYGDLAPIISAETLALHHGKHHKAYVDNLNGLVPGTEFQGKSLGEIVKKAPPGPIFNNAAQIWNHTFYFESLAPMETILKNRPDLNPVKVALGDEVFSAPKGGTPLAGELQKKWPHQDDFRAEFKEKALKTFGSGWTWLVKKPDGSLEIVSTSNAATPLSTAGVPLLTCDVWEHAYYVDYQNRRAEYVDRFWQIVDWNKVSERYESAVG